MSDSLLPYFQRHGSLREVPEEQTLFTPHDTCPGLFLVESGLLHVSRPLPSGENLLMRRIYPGQFFGEVILFSENTFSGWMTAAADTKLRVLPLKTVETLIISDKTFRHLFFSEINRRVTHLNNRVEILTCKTVEERLLLFLMQNDGICLCSRQEAADQLGCSREALSRCITKLKNAKKIRRHKGILQLTLPQA